MSGTNGAVPVPINSLTPQTTMPVGGVVVITQPHPTDPTQRVFGTVTTDALPAGTGTGGTSTPISSLPVASSVTGSELVVVNQDGIDKQATLSEVSGYGSTTSGTTTPPPVTSTPPVTTPPPTTPPPITTTPPVTTPPTTPPVATTPPATTTTGTTIAAGPYIRPAVAAAGGPSAYTYPQGTSGPYGGIGDTGTGAGPQAALYGRSLGSIFGTYSYPNPGGTDGVNHNTLTQSMTKLIADMGGVIPKTMNAFINNAYDSIQRVGDGTFAYGWHNDDSTISGPNGYLRPIIGLKLHGYNDPKNNNDTFVDVKNGVYDNLFLTEINAWISLGYKHLVYRIAYEFNGTFMPDYFGSDTTTNANFAAAFRHVALLLKNRGTAAGITVEITFNPSYINGIDTDVMNGWPGDDVVDIIDTDQYNPCYPRYSSSDQGFVNFNPDGTPSGTFEPTQSTWVLNPSNRKKFWNYPGIKDDYNAQGVNHDYDPGGWSTLRAISIAKAKGKPIAFSECGTGGGTNTDAYTANDPTWVRWFWQVIQSAISQGVGIAHINIWNIYADDGQWNYGVIGESISNPYEPQPLVKAAFRKYFGDGKDNAAIFRSEGFSKTVSNGWILPPRGTATPSAEGATLNNTTGQLVDNAGIVWTLVAISGGFYVALGGIVDDRTFADPIQSLLYHNRIMYCQTQKGYWYSFGYGAYNPETTDPRTTAYVSPSTTPPATTPTTPSSATPSANGTTINSTSGSLVDNAGQVWTLSAISGGYQSLRNGAVNADVSGNPIQTLLYYNTVIYALAANGTWYSWNGSIYVDNHGDPRGATTMSVSGGATLPTHGTATPSASGSTINSTSGSLADANGVVWTLTVVASRNNGLFPTLGGVIDDRSTTAPVTQLLYYNNVMYAQTTDGNFYSYNSGTYTNNNGDPRGSSSGSGYANITDTTGHTATINFATASAPQNYYTNDTGLNTNIYFYQDQTTLVYHIIPSSSGYISSATVHTGGINLSVDLPNVTFV